MTEVISSKISYEQLRLDNIKRNELELERLGLSKPLVKSKAQNVPKKRIKIESATDYGVRRSSSRNVSRAPGFFNEAAQFNMSRNDDDNDEDYDDDGDEDIEGFDEESIPAPTKKQRVKKELSLLNNIEENEPVIKMEKAKTGRSSCRKCRENINQDTMRVGMKAWIMGRSSW